MKYFLIALQFLTIFPVKIKEAQNTDFGKSLIFFPIVGLFIGVILALTNFMFNFLPPPVKAVLILSASIIVSGALHLDGFADTCDGLYGNKTKEEALAIMKDSGIGAMAAIGLILLLIAKFSILTAVVQQNLWKLLIAMPVFSRWMQVFACFFSTYARTEGKAKYFVESAGKKELLTAAFFTLAVLITLLKLKGVFLFIITMIPLLIFIKYVKKRINGMTGDTIGATAEIAEVLILFFGVLFL